METKQPHGRQRSGYEVRFEFPLAFNKIFSQVCITLALNILLIKDGLCYLDLY